MSEIQEATRHLMDWASTGEWERRLARVQMDHVDSVFDSLVSDDPLDLVEMLGDNAIMLTAFVLEDFFTRRFGGRKRLNVVDDYLKRRGWRESDSGRQYLGALRDSIPSLYEVVDIDPGRSLTLRDLLVSGKAVTVRERQASHDAVRWDRLAARVVLLNGERVLTGGVLHFRHEAADTVLAAFERAFERRTRATRKAVRRTGKKGRKRRLKSRSATRRAMMCRLPCARIFSRFWLSDLLSRAMAPLPELRNTDDEALVFCEVRLPIVGDVARITAALDKIDGFDRHPEGLAQWTWNGPGSPTERLSQARTGRPAAGSQTGPSTTVLGSAEIGPDLLKLAVNSRERAERGQELLSSCLGDLVGQALISSQDPYEAMRAHPTGSEQRESRTATEAEVQALHSYLDQHYRHTLDDPLPVLGGRTLRRAVKTRKGREQVVDWLKQLDQIEQRRAADQGSKPYDTRWIWQELGVERRSPDDRVDE